ncbi:MAG: TIGR01777 family oxidoreductase [Bacteroidales bacterium]
MRIAISGATGLIGSQLTREFNGKGWEVVVITRADLYSEVALPEKLKDVQIVINLAGSPVIQRWTETAMKNIYDSRILTTRNLVNAIHQLKVPPKLFISTSATGIYENGGPYTESNFLLSPSFLGKVCQDWEREAFKVEDMSRLVIFRLGIVLDHKGGALSKLLPFFKAGLGGPIGKGNQYFPWVHLTDVVRAYLLAIENPSLKGVYNLTAPQLINNKDFTTALGEVLHRPAIIPIPAFALKLLFGRGSTTLTEGQGVIPQRLQDAGFSFHFPMIHLALKYTLKK